MESDGPRLAVLGRPAAAEPSSPVRTHIAALRAALPQLEREAQRLQAWSVELATVLHGGGRLLVAGNGGSAAQAQHLTAELVGRYREDRTGYSAFALPAETSTLTALLNDYPAEMLYARQVHAHGREGDILLLLSTSGRSPNLLQAAEAGSGIGLLVWSMTGARPSPLHDRSHDCLSVIADPPTVQEIHQVAIQLLCEGFDREVANRSGTEA